jgi:hypothetical protein
LEGGHITRDTRQGGKKLGACVCGGEKLEGGQVRELLLSGGIQYRVGKVGKILAGTLQASSWRSKEYFPVRSTQLFSETVNLLIQR